MMNGRLARITMRIHLALKRLMFFPRGGQCQASPFARRHSRGADEQERRMFHLSLFFKVFLLSLSPDSLSDHFSGAISARSAREVECWPSSRNRQRFVSPGTVSFVFPLRSSSFGTRPETRTKRRFKTLLAFE